MQVDLQRRRLAALLALPRLLQHWRALQEQSDSSMRRRLCWMP